MFWCDGIDITKLSVTIFERQEPLARCTHVLPFLGWRMGVSGPEIGSERYSRLYRAVITSLGREIR